MKKLDFRIPFSGFASTTFINCFTSVYLYAEGISCGGEDTVFCNQWENGTCNGCGHCDKKPQAVQERYFFLFDTLCGHSSLRCHFDGSLTEGERMVQDGAFYDGGSAENIEFLFGFAGYEYSVVQDPAAMKAALVSSVERGRPVLARLKENRVPFCVITGYDADTLICPDFRCAQATPDPAPAYGGIDTLYIVGEKTEPKYKLLDGLRRIERVMEWNMQEHLWEEYMSKIGTYGPDSLGADSPEGRKARMNRVAQTMWHTFNCHNFAEVFRSYAEGGNADFYDRIGDMGRLRDPRFAECIRKISGPLCGYTHDLAWSLIGLEECIPWDDWKAHYYGDMIELVLSQIQKNDEGVLLCVRELIEALS